LHASTAATQLEGLRVAQAMTSSVQTIAGESSVERTLDSIEQQEFSSYPVVDGLGRCLGLTNLARLRRVVAEGGGGRPVAELVRLKEYVYPEDALFRAVVRMNALGTRQLPVVEKEDQSLRGIITMSDIFRAQAQAVEDHGGAESSPVGGPGRSRDSVSLEVSPPDDPEPGESPSATG
jgi:CBS domain-containing protein